MPRSVVSINFTLLCFSFLLGGLGRDGNVLHSAEFYDIQDKKWSQVSSLKVGRTEHVMALVYGIPTVIGGKNSFLTTMKRILLYFALWGKIHKKISFFFFERATFFCFRTYYRVSHFQFGNFESLYFEDG